MCIRDSLPTSGFESDISFHGWVTSHATRRQSTSSCMATNLKCDFALYKDFTGYLDGKPEGIARRARFRDSMRRSRLALCPESISGVFPYRFWEAMSAGRVPFLVGSDFIWPFEEEIPFADFTLTCPRECADDAGT